MDSAKERLLVAVVAAGLGYGLCSMYRKTIGEFLAHCMRRVNVRAIAKAKDAVYGEVAAYPAMNLQLLEEIIRLHQCTAVGRERGLIGLSARQFRSSFPLSDFKDYIELIERMKAGEEAVLLPGQPKAFATSSGTTGVSKYIPVDGGMMEAARSMFSFTFSGPVTMMPGVKALMQKYRAIHFSTAVASSRLRSVESGVLAGPLSTIPMDVWMAGMPKFMVSLMHSIMSCVGTQPAELLETVEDYEAMLYLNLLFAVMTRDAPYIMIGMAPTSLHVFQMMEQNREHLVRDVRAGAVTCPWVVAGLSAQQQKDASFAMCDLLSHEEREARAKELEDEFSCGFIKIAPRIWPNLKFFSTAVGGPFGTYKEELQHYIGDTPICSSLYVASEGALGMARDLTSADYILCPRDCFFEFLDVSEHHEEPHKALLRADELIIGKEYEVVITNKRGFLRYRLGDVIRVKDMLEGVWPVVEICYRMGSLLDIFGEKTSEEQVSHALDTVLGALDCRVVNFTSRALTETSPAAYRIYVEVHGDLAEGTDLSEKLDAELQSSNDVFRDCRAGGKLGPLQALLVPAGTFDVFFKLLVDSGAAVSQVKVPHLIKKQAHIDLFESFFQ